MITVIHLIYAMYAKKTNKSNNMADRAIRVAVLEGYFASLTTLGLPMPLSLQLQQSNLRLEKAMWTAKSTRTGFSVNQPLLAFC